MEIFQLNPLINTLAAAVPKVCTRPQSRVSRMMSYELEPMSASSYSVAVVIHS
jgi:hypothetical protein